MNPALDLKDAQAPTVAIHASAVVIGEGAVILRGPSGSGKSSMALALIAAARSRGGFARLVGDDRLLLRRSGARIIVAGHPAIRDRIERRFVGVTRESSEHQAVAVLVVDLSTPLASAPRAFVPPRMPDDDGCWTQLLGLPLPRLNLPAAHAGAPEAILHALHENVTPRGSGWA